MISETVHRFIMAYDVSSDARRVRVAKTLETYGDRIQYSVFLVDVKPAKLIRLKLKIAGQMELNTDSLLVCDLGPVVHGGVERLEFIGMERNYSGQGPFIL